MLAFISEMLSTSGMFACLRMSISVCVSVFVVVYLCLTLSVCVTESCLSVSCVHVSVRNSASVGLAAGEARQEKQQLNNVGGENVTGQPNVSEDEAAYVPGFSPNWRVGGSLV